MAKLKISLKTEKDIFADTLFLLDAKWCLGRESNPHALTDTGFSYQLRLSPPVKNYSLWSGLYLHLLLFS
jgi:hypothetical protein